MEISEELMGNLTCLQTLEVHPVTADRNDSFGLDSHTDFSLR